MLPIRKETLKVVNPDSGKYEGIAAITGDRGESSYEIAQRLGFTGTEAEFLEEFVPENVVLSFEEFKADVENTKTRVSTLETTVNNLDIPDVSSLTSDVSTLKSNMSTVQGNVSTLQGTVSTQGTTIGTHTSDISSLQSRMTTAESNISGLSGQTGGMSVESNAGAHNSIFRGKDLANIYTVDQICAKIADGSFDDLFIGDFFTITINSSIGGSEVVKCVLADFDTFLGNGDTELTKHHATIVPADCFKTTAQMNTSDVVTGGYKSTVMHSTTLPAYATAIANVIGSSHLLSYKSLISNASNNSASMAGAGLTGAASGWEWVSLQLRLMSEVNLYGSTVMSSSFYDIGANNTQFNLFRLNPAAKIAHLEPLRTRRPLRFATTMAIPVTATRPTRTVCARIS